MTAQQVPMTKSSDKAFTPHLLSMCNIFKFCKNNSRVKKGAGFTLMELLLTVAILAFCLCGILLTYIQMFIFSDLSRDLTRITNLVQAKMEEIKKTDFATLASFTLAFDSNLFFENETQYNGNLKKGIIRAEVSNTSYGDLKEVRIVSSFKSRGRIIGEDKNLDGDLDTGEDTLIVNTRLDSPVEAVTLIADVE